MFARSITGRALTLCQSVVMLCGWEKRQDGSLHSWINVWVTGKSVLTVNTCHYTVILSALEQSRPIIVLTERYTMQCPVLILMCITDL